MIKVKISKWENDPAGGMGAKGNHKHPHKREAGANSTHAEEAVQPWRQKPEWCTHETGSPGIHRSWKGKECLLHGGAALPTPRFGLSDFRLDPWPPKL